MQNNETSWNFDIVNISRLYDYCNSSKVSNIWLVRVENVVSFDVRRGWLNNVYKAKDHI